MDKATPQVLITGGPSGLPYSKGLQAWRMTVTGLSAFRAYEVAEHVEARLHERGLETIDPDELDALIVEVTREVAGERYAANLLRWHQVENLDLPLVIVIGGTTGVGKSTIATQLAARLGIVRVVATDAIREVMRAMFSRELMPTLYASSFEAGDVLREAPLRPEDRVITGFREQTAAVTVGLRGVLDRAAIEGTSVIVEGAHAVPGFVDLEPWADRVIAVPLVITVDDEGMHHGHFSQRGLDSPARPSDRYEEGFGNIRQVQRYIKSQALSHGVPVIPNYDLDQTLTSVIDLIVARAIERVGTVAQTVAPHPVAPQTVAPQTVAQEGRTA